MRAPAANTHTLISLHVAGTVLAQPLPLTLGQRHRQRVDYLFDYVRQIAVVTVGP
jgi:hypothetical protein